MACSHISFVGRERERERGRWREREREGGRERERERERQLSRYPPPPTPLLFPCQPWEPDGPGWAIGKLLVLWLISEAGSDGSFTPPPTLTPPSVRQGAPTVPPPPQLYKCSVLISGLHLRAKPDRHTYRLTKCLAPSVACASLLHSGC